MGRNDGRLTPLSLAGRRVHIAGSADADVELERLRKIHALVRQFIVRTLSAGGGLVTTLGDEPMHSVNAEVGRIFDWTALEAADEYFARAQTSWPEAQGLPVVCVGLPQCLDRIPPRRSALWGRLRDSGKVQLVRVREGLSIGGVLRERQEQFGDLLVLLGGDVGVEHLADLYAINHKPVIPLDVELGPKNKASHSLYNIAISRPERFFEYLPPEGASAALSKLSSTSLIADSGKGCDAVLDLISHLAKPKAFYVRLQNRDSSQFDKVESYFRQVVDQVVEEAGFDAVEIGGPSGKEPFLNMEIFNRLDHCAIAFVDLTDMRPNCLVELGFALGIPKRVILTAEKGTALPFDVCAIPCNFWGDKPTESEIASLKKFMLNNSRRSPIRAQEEQIT